MGKMRISLEDALKDGSSGDIYIVFSEKIPEMYKEMGLKDATVYMSEMVFQKIRYKHNFSNEELLAVKRAIENPVTVIKVDGKLVVVTDLRDYNNFPIMAVLGAADGDRNNNFVSTIYGRENIVQFLFYKVKHTDAQVMFMDFDKIEDLRSKETGRTLDKIKRMVLESRGCKLHMTVERDGKKIELTENEIWAAYSLISEQLTQKDMDVVKAINDEVSRGR